MRILVTTLLAACLLATFAPRAADARGGNFRGPGGAIPPNLREPSDPTPPAPPPPSGPPAGLVPTAPAIPTPPPTPPRLPLVAPRAPTAAPRGVMTFSDWRFWYLHNREVLETRVPARRRLAVEKGLAQAHILPALLWAADVKNAVPHLQAAATIALGKAATSSQHVEVLRRAARTRSDTLVEESAVLGLGLLRRTQTALQFDAALLDAIRSQLLTVLKDNQRRARVRAFAATSLALLGDQPTRSPVVAKATTGKLFARLEVAHNHPDMTLSVLHALSLQPSASISDAQRDVLRKAFTQGQLGTRTVRSYVRSHLALALGRIGNAKDVPILLESVSALAAPDRNLRRSSTIALATLSARLEPEVRSALLRDLTALLETELARREEPKKHPNTLPMERTHGNLMLVGLARIAAVDLSETDGLTNRVAGAAAYLRRRVASGTDDEAAYGALALAWLGRGMRGSDNPERVAWLRSAGGLLRTRLEDKRLTAGARGAIAAALGILGDVESRPTLRGIVADKRLDMLLRGGAARGLGMLAGEDEASRRALGAAFQERRSEMFLIDCAAGLGLAGADDAAGALVSELRTGRSQYVKGAAALALADLGRGARAAVPGLIKLVKDPAEHMPTRTAAVAALGLIADGEGRASLARFTAHLNWRASTDFLNELFGML